MKQVEFFDRIQEKYEKQYNRVQAEDIKKWLNDKGLNDIQYQCLYDFLGVNCKFLPKIPDMSEFFETRQGMSSGPLPDWKYRQTGKFAIEEHKHQPVEWLCEMCRRVWTRHSLRHESGVEPTCTQITFYAVWSPLLKVASTDREKVKQLIISGDKDALDDFFEVAIEKTPIEEIEKLARVK